MSGRRRLAALLIAVLAGVVALLAGASSSSAAPPYTHKPHLSCNPFRPIEAHHIHCHGDGYLPNDHVTLTLHTKVYGLGTADANANGAFDAELALPAGVTGLHTVVGTGVGGVATDSASTQINIRSTGGSGTGGSGTGGQGAAAGGSSSGSGGLSTTGVAVVGLGVVGVGLVGVGGLVLMTGRRRRRALA
jgi:hypothetical protein